MEGCWKEYSLISVSKEGFCFEEGGPPALLDFCGEGFVAVKVKDQKTFFSRLKIGRNPKC